MVDLKTIPLLTRDELRAKLASDNPPKLVMVDKDWGFRAKHIPGSLRITPFRESFGALGKHDDLVVYCSSEDCTLSRAAMTRLLEDGFDHLSHYPGGLRDWEEAGLPLDGEWVRP